MKELTIRLTRVGHLACLDLAWTDVPLPPETLQRWENAPMQMAAAGAALTPGAVVKRHGGETAYCPVSVPNEAHNEAHESVYKLLLPLSEPQRAIAVPPGQHDRPEFYDFDLFHQPGQNPEFDQSLLSRLSYTVFDTETTGLQPAAGDEIISIGALRIVNGRLLQQESFDRLVKPRCAMNAESARIHGITLGMLEDQPSIEKVLPQFYRFAEDSVLVAHNAAFDMRFLQMQEARTGIRFTQPVLDTLLLSQVIHPRQPQHTLEAIAARLGVTVIGRHTALGDAIVTGEIFLKMAPLLAANGIRTLKEARDAAQQTLYAHRILARIFHRTGTQLERKVHVYPICGLRGSDPICTAGLRGCWRMICRHFAPPLLRPPCANSTAIGVARERKLPRNSYAIIPRSGEISGLRTHAGPESSLSRPALM